MKIAMLGSAEYPTPLVEKQTIYAPLQILDQIANGMVKRGHDVTVFCAEGSTVKAKKATAGLDPLFSVTKNYDKLTFCAYEQTLLAELYRQADKFDVIHVHPVILGLPFASLVLTPTVFTLHDPIKDKQHLIFPLYNKFRQIHYVSISDEQKNNLRDIEQISTVYNGIGIKQFPFSQKGGKHLVWAGRIVPDKGAEIAIQIAKKTNIPLKIAGQYYPDDPVGFEYWQKKIKPNLESELIECVGLIPHKKIFSFYQDGLALVNPIEWDEPFGLVVPEANACGTPVVAYARGSMPELIKDGVNGFLVRPGDIDGMVKAVEKIHEMPEGQYQAMRRACRKHVEENFTVEKMVNGYEKVYEKMIRSTKSFKK